MTFLNFSISSSSPLISYSGQWQSSASTESAFVNDICGFSQGANFLVETNITSDITDIPGGNGATLDFIGTNITIGGDCDFYSVQLDNEPQFAGNVTLNGPGIVYPLWNAQNLNNSHHTVGINFFDFTLLGCISIGREIGPPGYTGTIFNVTLDDQSPFIVYNGSWSSSFSATAFNQSVHSTTEGGSSASLHFQGSSVELYGTTSGTGLFRVQVDNEPGINVGPQFVNDIGNPLAPKGTPGSNEFSGSQPPSTLLFYMDGLDENKTHVVTLTNSESTAPLSLDFATVRGSQRFFNNDTPSPNQNFTDTTTMSTPAHSRRTPVGAIIGGAVGGFIILSLMGLLFLRRRRGLRNYRSTAIIDDGYDTPSGDTDVTVTSVIEATPYIVPDSKVTQVSDSNTSASNPANVFAEPGREPGGANQVSNSNSPEMDSLQVPTLFTFTESQVVETSPQRDDHCISTTAAQHNTPSQNLADQPQENSSVSRVSLLRERDAGRFVERRLPPAYNENWRHSDRPLSLQEEN